jgi:outer membrane lipoprotein SlyB
LKKAVQPPIFSRAISRKQNMSDISSATGAAGAKTLWVAIGVLGAAVVGLGGALYYQQSKQAPAAAAATAASAPTTAAAPAAAGAEEKKHVPAVAPHGAAPKPAARTAQLKPVPAEAPAVPAAKPVCVDCATVVAVTPIEREGQGSGTGAVAGGVLGAVIGNQIGQGQGKDVATIVGAIGGGIAGNQIEKKMKKVTVYQVELRMDDGSRRTLELAEPAAVGARVRVNGSSLSPLTNTN